MDLFYSNSFNNSDDEEEDEETEPCTHLVPVAWSVCTVFHTDGLQTGG
jgi:hypothetical protein